jgi:hypothetical protein
MRSPRSTHLLRATLEHGNGARCEQTQLLGVSWSSSSLGCTAMTHCSRCADEVSELFEMLHMTLWPFVLHGSISDRFKTACTRLCGGSGVRHGSSPACAGVPTKHNSSDGLIKLTNGGTVAGHHGIQFAPSGQKQWQMAPVTAHRDSELSLECQAQETGILAMGHVQDCSKVVALATPFR